MTAADADANGRTFVQRMMGLLAAVVFLYVFLHVVVPDGARDLGPECAGSIDWSCLAEVDALGDVHFRSPGDVQWYVGAQTALAVREEATANSRHMADLRGRITVHAGGHVAPLLNDRSPVDVLIRAVNAGGYREALETFDRILDSLSTASANTAAIELAEIRTDLDRLNSLRRRQQDVALRLTPPLQRSFFWTSPAYSMVEVLFFATFGVLTSLLVNATEYARRGGFHPRERFVAYAKLMYGPLLALILYFAMINALVQPGSYEVRVWTLPLVSFVLGYASRRIVLLIDRLLGHSMGAAEPVVPAGTGPATVKRRELVTRLTGAYRPNDLRELRSQLKDLAREVVETEAVGREER